MHLLQARLTSLSFQHPCLPSQPLLSGYVSGYGWTLGYPNKTPTKRWVGTAMVRAWTWFILIIRKPCKSNLLPMLRATKGPVSHSLVAGLIFWRALQVPKPAQASGSWFLRGFCNVDCGCPCCWFMKFCFEGFSVVYFDVNVINLICGSFFWENHMNWLSCFLGNNATN